MITNELKSCVFTLPNHEQTNEHIDLDIRLYKNTEIDIEIVNGTPFFNISIHPKASILNSGEGYDFTTLNSITEVQDATNKYIENIIKQYLYEISKDYNADIVGFAGIYGKKVATQETLRKINFSKVFEDSFFKVNVETEIHSSNLFNKQ